MRRALSVKEFNEYIKVSFKHDPIFQNAHLRGEIANLKFSHNHLYFSLKEGNELIDCVIYYYEDTDIVCNFETGDSIELYGNLLFTNYSSKLVINVKKIEEFGISVKYKEFLKLRLEFEKKGFFDIKNKKSIKEFPNKIGLITSESGAAIEDFKGVINQKANDITIYFYPTKVQGESAITEILDGLSRLEKMNLDAIVLTRGGGSSEDLSVFNEKSIVEKIFSLKTPVISAIGHRIDLSLTDLVADLSLQTPTEAGVYLVRNYAAIYDDSKKIFSQMTRIISERISLNKIRIDFLKKDLEKLKPVNIVEEKFTKLNALNKKFDLEIEKNIEINNQKLKLANIKLNYFNDLIKTMKEKISIKDIDGNLIFSKKEAEKKEKIIISFTDGDLKVGVDNG